MEGVHTLNHACAQTVNQSRQIAFVIIRSADYLYGEGVIQLFIVKSKKLTARLELLAREPYIRGRGKTAGGLLIANRHNG